MKIDEGVDAEQLVKCVADDLESPVQILASSPYPGLTRLGDKTGCLAPSTVIFP